MRFRRDTTRYRQGALAVLFLLLVVNSWSWNLVADAATDGGVTNETQQGILASMNWMNSSLPRQSNIVSATTSDYSYFYLLYPGRDAGYSPLVTPDEVVAASLGNASPVYVVLTKVGTLQVAPSPDQNPFNLYPSDNRFQLAYNESGVLVYELR